MKLERIFSLLFASPWAILPAKHYAIRKALDSYLERGAFSLDTLETGAEETPRFEVVGSTAIVGIEGVILNKCSGLEAACGAFSLDTFKKTLKEVGAREDITNVVLNIASGGGTVTGTPEAGQAIKALSKIKNVIAYTDSCAASAAYWLACNARRIFLSQSAEVGSIGVYCAYLDESANYAAEGYKLEVFKGGNSKFKAMGLPGTSLTDEQKTYLQDSVNKSYNEFVSLVSSNRKKVSEDALSGKMFDAEEAVNNGLADGIINDLDSLIEYLNK